MASVYRRGKVWWLKYYVGGKGVQRSLGTKDAREAEKTRRQYEAAEAIELLPQPSTTPIAEFLQDLCEYWRKTRRGKGATSDISRLRMFFGTVCPGLEYPVRSQRKRKANPPSGPRHQDPKTKAFVAVKRLEDLSASMITSILRQRYLAGEITGKTANRYRGVLSSLFSYAKKHHRYVCPDRQHRNPVEGVERFPEKPIVITWLNLQQIDEQLKVLEDDTQLRAMAAVGIFAGLRREEVVWLTRDDVDLAKAVIHVRAKEVDGRSWQPKTGKDRSVPISGRLVEILSAYTPSVESTWYFPSTEGNHWHPDTFGEKIREINEAHGLSWSCGDYRHTFGSHLAMKGVSLYKISSLMGNSPDICRKHYAALVPQEMREEVEFAGPGAGSQDPPAGANLLVQQLLQRLDAIERSQKPQEPPRLRIAE